MNDYKLLEILHQEAANALKKRREYIGLAVHNQERAGQHKAYAAGFLSNVDLYEGMAASELENYHNAMDRIQSVQILIPAAV